jgi:hypothetical protein
MARLPDTPRDAISTAIRTAAASRSPACILDTDGAFLFVNEAWEQLPPEAGGPSAAGAPLVGSSFLAREAQTAIRDAWRSALAAALSGRAEPRIVASEWNDGETARLLSTRVDPIAAPGAVLGVVLRRSVARERPVDEVYAIGDRAEEDYRDARGRIVQCACCRRVRDPADASRWEFVRRLALRPAEAARDLCELCAELHVGA